MIRALRRTGSRLSENDQDAEVKELSQPAGGKQGTIARMSKRVSFWSSGAPKTTTVEAGSIEVSNNKIAGLPDGVSGGSGSGSGGGELRRVSFEPSDNLLQQQLVLPAVSSPALQLDPNSQPPPLNLQPTSPKPSFQSPNAQIQSPKANQISSPKTQFPSPKALSGAVSSPHSPTNQSPTQNYSNLQPFKLGTTNQTRNASQLASPKHQQQQQQHLQTKGLRSPASPNTPSPNKRGDKAVGGNFGLGSDSETASSSDDDELAQQAQAQPVSRLRTASIRPPQVPFLDTGKISESQQVSNLQDDHHDALGSPSDHDGHGRAFSHTPRTAKQALNRVNSVYGLRTARGTANRPRVEDVFANTPLTARGNKTARGTQAAPVAQEMAWMEWEQSKKNAGNETSRASAVLTALRNIEDRTRESHTRIREISTGRPDTARRHYNPSATPRVSEVANNNVANPASSIQQPTTPVSEEAQSKSGEKYQSIMSKHAMHRMGTTDSQLEFTRPTLGDMKYSIDDCHFETRLRSQTEDIIEALLEQLRAKDLDLLLAAELGTELAEKNNELDDRITEMTGHLLWAQSEIEDLHKENAQLAFIAQDKQQTPNHEADNLQHQLEEQSRQLHSWEQKHKALLERYHLLENTRERERYELVRHKSEVHEQVGMLEASIREITTQHVQDVQDVVSQVAISSQLMLLCHFPPPLPGYRLSRAQSTVFEVLESFGVICTQLVLLEAFFPDTTSNKHHEFDAPDAPVRKATFRKLSVKTQIRSPNFSAAETLSMVMTSPREPVNSPIDLPVQNSRLLDFDDLSVHSEALSSNIDHLERPSIPIFKFQKLQDVNIGSGIESLIVYSLGDDRNDSNAGLRLSVATDDSQVQSWDLHGKSAMSQQLRFEGGVESCIQSMVVLSVHDNEAIFMTGAVNGDICVWRQLDKPHDPNQHNSSPQLECLGQVIAHSRTVNGLSVTYGDEFAGVGDVVASCSLDGTLALWVVEQATRTIYDTQVRFQFSDTAAISIHAVAALNVRAISPTAFRTGYVAAGGEDGSVQVWDAVSRDRVWCTRFHRAPVSALIVMPNHLNKLISGSFDSTICVWNAHTGDCLQVLKGHTEAVTAMCCFSSAFAQNHNHFISAGCDGRCCIWDVQTGECSGTFEDDISSAHAEDEASSNWVTGLQCASGIMVWGGWDGRVHVCRCEEDQFLPA